MQATWNILIRQYFIIYPCRLSSAAQSRIIPKCYEEFLLILRPRIRWTDGIKMYTIREYGWSDWIKCAEYITQIRDVILCII